MREDVVKMMLNCFKTCKEDLKYSDEQAMHRVLEIVEQEIENMQIREGMDRYMKAAGFDKIFGDGKETT